MKYKLVGFLGDGSEHDIPAIATGNQIEFTLTDAIEQRKSLLEGGWLSDVNVREIDENNS